jgi:hypothetical protein
MHIVQWSTFLVGTLLFWVGGFFAVRALMRLYVAAINKKYADPGRYDSHGRSFHLYRLSRHLSKTHSTTYIEYTTALPDELSDLHLIAGEGLHQRTRILQPFRPIEIFGAPDTDDDAFNGLFDFTAPPSPTVRTALQNPELRRVLQELLRAYGSIWVDGGTVRVWEVGDFDRETANINFELLAHVLSPFA